MVSFPGHFVRHLGESDVQDQGTEAYQPMNRNATKRTSTTLLWPTAFVGSAGLWYWLAPGGGLDAPLGAATLVAAALLASYWLRCARATRRFHAAMDAFANREIERAGLNGSLGGPYHSSYRLELPSGRKPPADGYNRLHGGPAAVRVGRQRAFAKKDSPAVDRAPSRASLG
jgi:hypothetical protein